MKFVSKKLFPSDFESFGKVAGLQKGEKDDWKGITFVSCCLLNLNSIIRIFAIYDITNYQQDVVPDTSG